MVRSAPATVSVNASSEVPGFMETATWSRVRLRRMRSMSTNGARMTICSTATPSEAVAG